MVSGLRIGTVTAKRRGHARNLILAGALLGIGAHRARAENTVNLLINPGAETGDLTGWTILSGSGTVHADNGTFDPTIQPQAGSWDFVGGTGASAAIYQEPALSGLVVPFQLIDAGDVTFNISFYEQSLNQVPADTATVTFGNYDASDVLISSASGVQAANFGGWTSQTYTVTAPAGTRNVIYEMNFTRNSGSDLDAFIDSNSLTISYNGSAWNSSAGDHLWNSSANWDSGVPAANGAAVLTRLSGSETVAFNGNYDGDAALSSLFIDATDGITLSQSANTMVAINEYVGNVASGTYNQSGGTNGVGTLDVGISAGSHGAYTLSGGSLVAFNVNVGTGTGSSGTFNVSNGEVNVTGGTFALDNSGTLSLSGGTLTASVINIGYGVNSANSVSISGGSATATSAIQIGASSTVNLSAGTLNIGSFSTNNPNWLNWTGGTLNVTSDAFGVYLGNFLFNTFLLNGNQSANFSGVRTVDINGVTGANIALLIGFDASAAFTQNGTGAITVGSVATPRNLDLACVAGANAAYTLSNAATSLTVHGDMYVGGTEGGSTGGTANFNISSGSATIDNLNINLGGTVTLAGGTLTAGYLSGLGAEYFNWTGGTLNITVGGPALNGLFFPNSIVLNGNQSANFTGASNFSYNGISGVNVALIVGLDFDSEFTQNGTGEVTIGTRSTPRNLDLASIPGENAFYILASAATTLTVHGTMYVGGNESGATGGNANFTIENGSASIDTLSILSDGVVALERGTLAVGVLDVSQHPAGFQWTGGNLTLLDGGIYGLSALTVPLGSTLAGSGSIVANITLNGNITVANQADDLEIHGLVSGQGNISVAAEAYFTADSLLVNALTVAGITRIRPGGSNTVRVNSLVIAGSANHYSGTLDITDNPLIVEASSPTDKAAKILTLQSEVQSGESAGTWTGTGITSSTVANDVLTATTHTYHTVVAIVDNGAYPSGTGFTSFGGQTVDANSIIITRALAGDANLDGTVNNTDLVALLTHYGSSGQTQATGDFNGDATVNNTDLVALLTDYSQSLPASFSLTPDANVSSAQATTAAAPEPASLALLAWATPLLLRRRRTPNPKIQP